MGQALTIGMARRVERSRKGRIALGLHPREVMIKGLFNCMRERALCFTAGKKENRIRNRYMSCKRAYRIEVRQLARP